jgi:hypothetical protein
MVAIAEKQQQLKQRIEKIQNRSRELVRTLRY